MMIPLSAIQLEGNKLAMQQARERIGADYEAPFTQVKWNGHSLSALDRRVKHGGDLTFEEAFLGMCHVVAATNQRAFQALEPEMSAALGSRLSREKVLSMSVAFMQGMAMKEALGRLTTEEVAGIAAASLADVVVRFDLGPRVLETCGMGGDTGFAQGSQSKKTINASTLSSFVLAALGIPIVKHGSYANTSAMGSTDAMERLGARIAFESIDEVMSIWRATGFIYFDAHWCKTIHDLSHLLMMETINHIAGPMSPPIAASTRLSRLMGVNEKVHPAVIARAFATLHRLKVQCMGNVAVIAGLKSSVLLDTRLESEALVRPLVVLDECSPVATLVAITSGGSYRGTFQIQPSDFGTHFSNPDSILLRNDPEVILQANLRALRGQDADLTNYLAMNAALGLFLEHCLPLPSAIEEGRLNPRLLKECFENCLEVIHSGAAYAKLLVYVQATGGVVLV